MSKPLDHMDPPVLSDSLAELSRQLVAFAAERDWGQFHSPKNLASALDSLPPETAPLKAR